MKPKLPLKVCCIYCLREFYIQRWDAKGWHDCPKSKEEKRKVMGRYSSSNRKLENSKRQERQREEYRRRKLAQYDYEYQPAAQRPCPRCKAPTVNRYLCHTCWQEKSRSVDVEAAVTLAAGGGRRKARLYEHA
jgi:hypothetical protein